MITVIINGETVMNADPGQWRSTPPDIDALKLATGGDPQPWLQLVMMTMAQAATKMFAGQQSDAATILVDTRADGWTVDYTSA